MTINCLVVDDEELARTLLENYIERLPFLNLIGQCKNPLEAMAVLHEKRVDLMFLDIQMPEITGVDFLKTLAQPPLTILTTAYSDFALEGYTLNVADYLLKPFSFDRFMQAVQKASDRIRPTAAATETTSKNHLLVKSEHRIHRLAFDDIRYIQSMQEYVAFYTVSSGRILSLGSLKSLEESLPTDQFVRIHKSFIVAASGVKTLEGNQITLDKERLPIGASYRDAVLKKLFG